MDSNGVWQWSEPYKRWYRMEWDLNGKAQYIWDQQTQPGQQQPQQQQYQPYSQSVELTHLPAPSLPQLVHPSQGQAVCFDPQAPHSGNGPQTGYPRLRVDSGAVMQPDTNNSYIPQPQTQLGIPGMISGTSGICSSLDPSFTIRTDARQFFTRGRVFAYLHHEAAGETALRQGGPYKDQFTVVKFGEQVFSQIRRMIVVSNKNEFCYACPISTYTGRATLKPGCNPREHAIVYVKNTRPVYLSGENGMRVEPIAINTSETGERLKPTSRVRLGLVQSVQHNIKVKNIGVVANEDMSKFLNAFQEFSPGFLSFEEAIE